LVALWDDEVDAARTFAANWLREIEQE